MRNCRIAYSLTFASGSPQVHPIRARKVRAVALPAGADVASGRAGWAFRPPRDAGVPPVRDTSWARDAVDRFILARLESKGLSPAIDADRHTWLRRVSLDLVGLPPSPEQIVEFLSDSSPRGQRASRRSVSGITGVRRALGEALAGPDRLCRPDRHGQRHLRRARLEVSRLRHRGIQHRQAV